MPSLTLPKLRLAKRGSSGQGSRWPCCVEAGQFVAPEVAAVLCKAAKNGGMTRIQMDDDKRWRWVCAEVAARNDRSVPKE